MCATMAVPPCGCFLRIALTFIRLSLRLMVARLRSLCRHQRLDFWDGRPQTRMSAGGCRAAGSRQSSRQRGMERIASCLPFTRASFGSRRTSRCHRCVEPIPVFLVAIVYNAVHRDISFSLTPIFDNPTPAVAVDRDYVAILRLQDCDCLDFQASTDHLEETILVPRICGSIRDLLPRLHCASEASSRISIACSFETSNASTCFPAASRSVTVAASAAKISAVYATACRCRFNFARSWRKNPRAVAFQDAGL